ncbi:unnamed protein product [Closterium sp. NIES-54]
MATRYLTSQRQDGATLWAHASGALKAPLSPDPLPTDPEPTPAEQEDYDRRVLARDMWDSRNAATDLALTELLSPTEAVHFAQVETAQGIWDAVVARYSTPSSASLSRFLMPFVFPNLGSFATMSGLVTHLRSLDASFRAACTDAQLLVAPPHVAHCALLPTFTATRTSVAVSISEDNAAVSAADWQKRGKSGKKGGKGGGRGGGGGGGAGSGGGGGGGGGDAPGGGSLEGVAGHTGPPTGGVPPGRGVGPQQQPQQQQPQQRQQQQQAPQQFQPWGPLLQWGPQQHWGPPPHPCVCVRDDHSAARCFCRLDDFYCARWGPVATTPRWARLLACKIPVFDLSMDDARQYALYADVDYSADGSVCSRVRRLACLPPASVDLCLSSLGACVSALGACVASTPARNSTTLPCPVVPSGVLRSLHIPSFTRNLVGVGYLQDRGVTVTFVGGGLPAVCTDVVTGRVSATFTKEPRSGFYVLHTEHSPISTSVQVAASPQVVASPPAVASGPAAVSCSCRSFTHRTILWHHRLGHPSIPRLRTMASHRLVSGLPSVFPLLPPSPAPPCTPCVAGCLRATLHSSSLRPATAPFQTLQLDV